MLPPFVEKTADLSHPFYLNALQSSTYVNGDGAPSPVNEKELEVGHAHTHTHTHTHVRSLSLSLSFFSFIGLMAQSKPQSKSSLKVAHVSFMNI